MINRKQYYNFMKRETTLEIDVDAYNIVIVLCDLH